ncbi:uncharacterized protein LOC126794902 [Argentina anserina]|uniref:uncharacterized protein LOC126794902 n=1 Tax=Argentina anserina TaxID=57926 RepID=UPI0021765AFE|nr:uncharacterized protein LOC126794902 [Potentilla anserina]
MGEAQFGVHITPRFFNMLTEDIEVSTKKTRRTKPKVPREPQQPQLKINQKKVSDDSEPLKGSGAEGWPFQPPVHIPSQSTNADLDTIRSVLQKSEEVVERLKQQEENMAHEVTQRAKELRDKEFKLPFQESMPCLAETDGCANCYKEHGKEDLLKCAGLAKSLADCARRVRQQVGSGNK